MENENHRSSTDNGFLKDDLKPLGFQDFDFEENHVWCESCKKLKQELKKLQDEHALNYSTLKKKIISTDLLIKKYKAKCDDHDAQSKRHEEFFRKYEELQRESETLNAQLGSTLQQLEPLKKAKISLEADNKQKENEIQSLRDKITGCELAVKQYEEISRETVTYKERYEILKKEKSKKVHNLETINQKNEALINKLKDENKNLKLENSVQSRRQKKLEGKLKKVVAKIEKYWRILKQNGVLPKGEKKPQFDRYLDINGETSVSQDDEDTAADDNEDEDAEGTSCKQEISNESEKFPWIFSPLVPALSPLPPSPMLCRMNKPLMSNFCLESDEENVDEMAHLLESELLRSSPVRQSFKPLSLLRKVQTRSPLVECKQTVSAVDKVNSRNSSKEINDKAVESLSDSDTENIISDENIVNVSDENTIGNCEKSEEIKCLDRVREIIDISDKHGGRSNNYKKLQKIAENKVERSEHSAFNKIKPKSTVEMALSKSLEGEKMQPVNSFERVSCTEAYIYDNFKQKDESMKRNNLEVFRVKHLREIKQTSATTSRKIDFVEKCISTSEKPEASNKLEIKSDNFLHIKEITDNVKAGVNKDTEEKKDFIPNGFDLDELVYDNDASANTMREVCVTPKLCDIECINGKDINTPTMHRSDEDKVNAKTLTENTQKCVTDHLHKSPDYDPSRTVSPENRSVFRQFSSGFILKSPPCMEDNEHKMLYLSTASTGSTNKSRLSFTKTSEETVTEIEKTEEKVNEVNKNISSDLQMSNRKEVFESELPMDTGLHDKRVPSEKTLPHQDSIGFKVDLEENEGHIESDISSKGALETNINDSGCQNTTEIHSNLEINVDQENKRSDICIEKVLENNVNLNDRKLENDILKQKYLLFVESRRSSQDSVESHSGNKVRNNMQAPDVIHDKQSSPFGDNVDSSSFKQSLDSHHIGKNTKEKKKKKKMQNDDAMQMSMAKNKNKPVESSQLNIPGNKKTLHQLVLQGLQTKTVPSSAVISPDVSDLTKHFENRPKSQNSVHSSSPLSPLPISPFDFFIPMIISPLPPSPVRQGEPLSPLPGSPWLDNIEDSVLQTVNSTSTKVSVNKKLTNKRSDSRPCSFSSDVPSHAIHVKPLNSCQIAPTATKPKCNDEKPVPAERDPLGKKQRISRVQNQAPSQKRKSLEPVPNVGNEKRKKCVIEKPGSVVQDRVPVVQEAGYWKDVDITLQQYISIYDMTPEDVIVKLMTNRDPTAVLPAVIIWTTQYLRSSETEMLSSIYKFCKGEEGATPGPFLTTQEMRLVDIFIYIIQKNIWSDFRTKILGALLNSILLKDVVTNLGRTALCRVFTALCQKEGNLEYVRVLFYNTITSGYLKFITLGLSIVGVWPQVLYKSDTEHSSLLTTIEFCVMKVLMLDQDKHEKIITCFTALCNWTKPKKMDSNVLLKRLIQDLQSATRQDDAASVMSNQQFEVYRSIEMMLQTEDATFFKTTFTMSCLNQMYLKIKSNSNLVNGGLPVMYIKNVIHLTASVLAKKIEPKYAAKTIKKFMFGLMNLATVTMEVQEAIASTMLDIAYIAPMPVFMHLTEWYMKEQKNISFQLKQHMENTRIMLIPYEGKLTSHSFK